MEASLTFCPFIPLTPASTSLEAHPSSNVSKRRPRPRPRPRPPSQPQPQRFILSACSTRSSSSSNSNGGDSNFNSFSIPRTRPSSTHAKSVPSLYLNTLRRHKLALHLIDLVACIRAEFSHPLPSTFPPLLSQIESTSTAIYPNPLISPPIDISNNNNLSSNIHHEQQQQHTDAKLRATARNLLWRLRKALYPLRPSSSLRATIEIARSACLHTPSSSHSLSFHAYAVQLSSDIVLLQELYQLRCCERVLNQVVVRHHGRNWPGLYTTTQAATQLSLDDHRVRGKSRLINAVSSLIQHIETFYVIHPQVSVALSQLNAVLHVSSENDRMAKRLPHGKAMLLRPRISDIPNFDRVTDTFLRGGQPSPAGMQWLYDYGVNVVVDLRGSDRRNQWHATSTSCLVFNVGDASLARVDEIQLFQQQQQHQQRDNNIITEKINDNHKEKEQDNDDDEIIKINGERDVIVNEKGKLSIYNIPIEDFGTPSLQQLEQFITLVNHIHQQNGVVFVHCKAGIGRTGTLIACWRIFNGMSADQALAKERLYSDCGGGLKQETFVRQYAAFLGGMYYDDNDRYY